MMVGEFEFDDTFINTIGKNSTSTRRPLNPFPQAAFVSLSIFMLLMAIILMNLLVGISKYVLGEPVVLKVLRCFQKLYSFSHQLISKDDGPVLLFIYDRI